MVAREDKAQISPATMVRFFEKIPKTLVLVFVALISFSLALGNPVETDGGLKEFWEKFKRSVIAGDKRAVASLSRFPLGMSYGKRPIKSRVEFLRRYSEVFNEQTSAAQCFATKLPETEPNDFHRFTVACPDEAGNDVVIFQFERDREGWRFVRLDNLNE